MLDKQKINKHKGNCSKKGRKTRNMHKCVIINVCGGTMFVDFVGNPYPRIYAPLTYYKVTNYLISY